MLGAMVAEALAHHPGALAGGALGPRPDSAPRCPPGSQPYGIAARVLRRSDLPLRWPDIEQRVAPGGWATAWQAALAWADAVWLVAPETGGELEVLSREVEAAGVRLLGCSADAVAVAASKPATHAALAGRVRQPDDVGAATGWVIKPGDGVAADGVRRVMVAGCGAASGGQGHAPRAGVAGNLAGSASVTIPAGWLAQPFVTGEPLSLCVLSDGRTARVLAVNIQHIEWHADGAAQYCGGVTNAISDRARFTPLAQAVQCAIPGLWGCWGIDCILPAAPAPGDDPDAAADPAAQEPVFIEVNPRLTTAFAQLRQATGVELLAALLDIAHGGDVPDAPAGHAVAFDLPATGGVAA